MKKFLAAIVGAALVTTPVRVCASPQYTLLGAALGAAAGLVVANNVHGIGRDVAVPVGAVLGGIIGNQVNQRLKAGHEARPVAVRGAEATGRSGAAVPADPHPGVDLIKVSILNANGVRTDVPILRVGDRFIGPQGESYPALPSSEQLRARYGM